MYDGDGILIEFEWKYRDVIREFFSGRMNQSLYLDGAHIWICEHGPFATLTIEPAEGGQYEIAVRFPALDKPTTEFCDKFSGYFARDGYLVGRNTHGH